jgi:GTPase
MAVTTTGLVDNGQGKSRSILDINKHTLFIKEEILGYENNEVLNWKL